MRIKGLAILLTLFCGLVYLDGAIEKGRPATNAKDSIETALAGEFRTVFANLLWIKVENYHHEFIEHNKDWAKNKDALGLIRIVTKLDPHFDLAYATGSRMLVDTNRLKEARAYLQEGVDNNPNSMLLHDEFGTVLARHLKDYKGSIYHLKRAYSIADDDWDKRRLMKLIHTVEKLSKPGQSSSSRA